MARHSKGRKSNSLNELGFTVKPTSKTDLENGWVMHIKGPTPEFWMKKTRTGRLAAFKTKDAKTESTIDGLFNFREKGDDIVGQRYTAPKENSPRLIEKSA